MRTWKKTVFTCLALLLAAAITGCSASGADIVSHATASAAVETASAAAIAVESVSQVSTGDLAQMAQITLSGNTASVEGEGVTVDGSTVTITAGGVYTLSGTLADGQIIVNAGKNDTVELVLQGVSIASSTSAAIHVQQAELTVITLAEGTENVLSDAADYVYPDSQTDEPNAALFAKSDLTVRGPGSLTVYGNGANGITSKDSLVIESGTVTVQAENNGLRGKDSVTVLGGSLTVTAGGDGIQSDNTTDANSGTILIAGGTLAITSGNDGIQAVSNLTVSGGSVTVVAGGGYTTESYSAEESYKGLKSSGVIVITGGQMQINSLDDSLHAAQSITISGGEMQLLTRDDGMHADAEINITGGTVRIAISYEGLESAVVNIGGGTVTLLASDDGINAANTAESAQGDRMSPAGGWGGEDDGSLQVNISGGFVSINAYGDGLDSNGSVTMTGGELYISGPLTSANGALDYNGSFTMNGGVLVAAGSVGMAQTPDSSSAQPSVLLTFSQSQAAGSTYLLTDAAGTVLLRYTPAKDFQCIVFSAPELSQGSTYSIYQSTDGTLTGATLLYNVTISGTITSAGASTGQTMQNGQQPNAQQQNMQQPNDMRRP